MADSIRMDVKTRGGHRTREILDRAARQHGIDRVEVGFFASAKYMDGTPVAYVAAIHEYGWGNVPERPFLRASIEKMRDELVPTIKAAINPETMSVDSRLANRLGSQAVGIIQSTISDGSFEPNPPNSPATIERKTKGKGGDVTTLIDTGRMRQSVTWKVVNA